MPQKTERSIAVTDDVYWKLAEVKLSTRALSIDEVLRTLLGMPENKTRAKRHFEDFAGYEGGACARSPAANPTSCEDRPASDRI